MSDRDQDRETTSGPAPRFEETAVSDQPVETEPEIPVAGALEGRGRSRSPEPEVQSLTPKQLLAVLAALIAVSMATIAVIHTVHKATVVELRLMLDEASLVVVPDSDPALGAYSAELLRSQLPVRTLRWTGAESFEATLAVPRPGRATAQPGASGVITLRAADGAPPFRPTVRLKRPMRLGLLPSGRDGLAITFDSVSEPMARRLGTPASPGPGDWRCEVPPREGLELRLREVAMAVGGETLPDPVALEPAAAAIVLRGGGRRAELGLAAESGEGLLASEGLLAPNLSVAAPLFFKRLDAQQREQSFVVSGRILFPRGEKQPVDLEGGVFLRLPEAARLKLISLRLAEGNLELALAGEVSSLELGPTIELMDERLPSLFVWLSTHQLPALVFSALAMLVVTVLSLLRLLGLWKKE